MRRYVSTIPWVIDVAVGTGTTTEMPASSIKPYQWGVHPANIESYSSSEVFICIKSPEVTIPFSAVNDDYCDCPDGSDEPGTSACSHIPGTKFYCPSARSVARSIFSSYVNDGICTLPT